MIFLEGAISEVPIIGKMEEKGLLFPPLPQELWLLVS